MNFYCCAFYLLLGKDMALHLNKLNPLHQKDILLICQNLAEICPVALKKLKEKEKSLQPDKQTATGMEK